MRTLTLVLHFRQGKKKRKKREEKCNFSKCFLKPHVYGLKDPPGSAHSARGRTVKDLSSKYCITPPRFLQMPWWWQVRIWSLHPIDYSFWKAWNFKRLCQVMVEMGHKWGLLATKLHVANKWKKAKNANSEECKELFNLIGTGGKKTGSGELIFAIKWLQGEKKMKKRTFPLTQCGRFQQAKLDKGWTKMPWGNHLGNMRWW